ncbi:ankyrin repeat and EF-hand domain-containing protein 1-like [Lampris incognitus]|uniref:ankyrin repeat and EF-hand domain-containing protein 1-like n=1 Tax=Lampris incognitus TaxID=2546036 RepID=UPI0024B59246|nr:ankyrin repeat and EF-hand domain-containing protein 1-like [Lampris incognitus]
MDPTQMRRVAKDRVEILQVYRLLQLVHKRDKAQIERFVRLGVPNLVNLTEPSEGKSALHLAAAANDTYMVSFLLSQGAHPSVQDKKGRTPVMLAAELGHDTTVALLAESDPDMDILDNEGKGVLFYCISPTKRRCLQVALNSKTNVNNVSLAGMPLFLLACQNARECSSMCLSILERGANPNAVDERTGVTALMEACRAGAVDLVRAILQLRGNPNAQDKEMMSAAHMAAEGGFFEVIVLLSAYGADLGMVSLNLTNALHLAAAGGFAKCCRFLAQRGCNAKQRNSEGLLPRQIAKDKATIKELKKAERLQGNLSNPDTVDPNEPWRLLLHDWSCEHQEALRRAMELLEEAEGPLDTITKDTFITAMKDNNVPVNDDQLQIIIQEHDKSREGLINITDFFKGVHFLQKAYTLPSYAPKMKKVGKGRKAAKKGKFVLPMPICVLPPALNLRRPDGGPPQFMIESYQLYTDKRRFDRDHPPCHAMQDDSPWYIEEPEKVFVSISNCVRKADMESLSLAFSQGVPVDIKDRYYKTPLMIACSSANLEVAKFLINLGADVNECDQFNWTPLHHACYAGQVDIIELLVNSGAQVNAVTMNGATPLMRAIQSCRLSCVDYLIKAGSDVHAKNKMEQNSLDIARTYGDKRIADLVHNKFDSLPKLKEQKGKGAGKVNKSKPAKAIASASLSTKEQETEVPCLPPSNLNLKGSLRENIIFLNTHITSTTANKHDVSYVPRTIWGRKLMGNAQMAARRKESSQHGSRMLDLDDSTMPLPDSMLEMSQDLVRVED